MKLKIEVVGSPVVRGMNSKTGGSGGKDKPDVNSPPTTKDKPSK